MKQKCKDIADPRYGRRLGNIHYKEDKWYITIDPIFFKERFKMTKGETIKEEAESFIKDDETLKSARLRDKYAKIRVKYTGEDIVIITALKTLFTISYS